jgi:hypothetical protein
MVQQYKNWANNCNTEQKPYYYPYEAALRWCGLVAKESLIMQNLEANNVPNKNIVAQLNAPCLKTRTEIIIHALENGKMPWCRDGKLCSPTDKPAAARLTVLHEDIKKWIAENYPDQKPAFLFDEIERSTHSAITLETYQTLQTENKRLEIENKDIRDRLEKGLEWAKSAQSHIRTLEQRIAESEALEQANPTEILNLKRTVYAFIKHMSKNTAYQHGNQPNISAIDKAICEAVNEVADSRIKKVLDSCKSEP